MKRIMIVEDNPEMEEFYRDFFTEEGFEVIGVARDGNSSLELYEKFNPKPDLVIMDYRLPDISGIEAAHMLLEKDPKVSIVMITADEEGMWEAATMGLAAIKKPAVFDKIIKTIERSVPGFLSSSAHKEMMSRLEGIFRSNRMYLVPESNPREGFRAFMDLVQHGQRGIIFTRRDPNDIKKDYTLDGIPIIWLSMIPSDKYETITPRRFQRLLLVLQESFRTSEPTVAYFEGFELFLTNIPFDRVLNMVQVLRDRVMRSVNLKIIISLDYEIMESRNYRILTKEFEVVKPEEIKKALQSDYVPR